MKKNLLAFSLVLLGLGASAQTPRLSLFEEFTGENCNPCGATNPGLNAILFSTVNTPKVVSLKWQVPIPSAPTATWSLYKTNKAEIDWRYGPSSSGYGYPSQWSQTVTPTSGINAAPTGLFDGQHQWNFGAPTDHPAYVTNAVIATAQSYTSAFSITMNRAWDATGSAVNLTVNIQATAPFTAVGPLVFRTVMVEELIQFATAPGSNGETTFQNTAIKSFPSIQTGVPMSGTWTVGQTQTFTLNCPIPSYTRTKEQIAFVGFIQDDGNRKVAQAVRAGKTLLTNDAVAARAYVPATCSSTIAPVVSVYNNGANPISSMTIASSSDAGPGPVTVWNGNLASGATTTVAINALTTGTAVGAHAFNYTITAIDNLDFNMNNNSGRVSYMVASAYQGAPVAESFSLGLFPPAGFVVVNPDNGPGWSRSMAAGAYNVLPLQSAKYDFFDNTVIGDQDELILPPVDLSGSSAPQMFFDIAYAQRTGVENDRLDVLASSDCGNTWTNVYSKQGSSLTQIAPTSTAYVPSSSDPTEWRTELFTLPGFNLPDVLVKFVVTNDNGNNLYLDNINLIQMAATTGIPQIKGNQLNVVLYPNPTSGVTTLNVQAPVSGAAKVVVTNLIGQVIFTKQASLNVGANAIELDMKDYAAGVYNVTLSTANGSLVKKLNVTK